MGDDLVPLPPPLPEGVGRGAGLASLALPLLSAGQEPLLGFWIEAGVLAGEALGAETDPARRTELEAVQELGRRSLEHMTRANIRLVYHWVHRSWTSPGRDTAGLDVEDLAAAGVDGLIHAIWMWDYRRGLKFSTYASNWILVRMQRAVLHARPGTTLTESAAIGELYRTRVTLETRLARAATVGELAAELQTTQAAVRDLMLLERSATAAELRLDQGLAETEGRSLHETLAAPGPLVEDAVCAAETGSDLAAALGLLTERQRRVVAARVGWDGPVMSEDEVAARFGVTVAQVRSVTLSAMDALRGLLTADGALREVAA